MVYKMGQIISHYYTLTMEYIYGEPVQEPEPTQEPVQEPEPTQEPVQEPEPEHDMVEIKPEDVEGAT